MHTLQSSPNVYTDTKSKSLSKTLKPGYFDQQIAPPHIPQRARGRHMNICESPWAKADPCQIWLKPDNRF